MEAFMADRSSVKKAARRVAEGGEADQASQNRQGDNRTPDKPIGQVKYADNEGGNEQKGPGGSTRTTLEKQDRSSG